MARNRGIKIFNEFMLDNPKTYTLLRGKTQSRPMTVSYHAPIEASPNGRPLTSHLKLDKPVDSLVMSRPALPTVPTPHPVIRDIARAKIEASKVEAHAEFGLSLPKNTGTSLLEENLLLRSKPKRNVYTVHSENRPTDKKILESHRLSHGNPLIPKLIPKIHINSKGRRIYSPDSSAIKKLNTPVRVKSPWKKDKVPKTNRLAVGNSIRQFLDLSVAGQGQKRPLPGSTTSKSVKGMNFLSQVDLDGSAFLIQQLKNIKTELLEAQKKNPKLSMMDAMVVISQIKSKISSLYNTCTNDELAKAIKMETKIKRGSVKMAVKATEEKVHGRQLKKKSGTKFVEQARVDGHVLSKASIKRTGLPSVKSVHSSMYSSKANLSTRMNRPDTAKSKVKPELKNLKKIESSAINRVSNLSNPPMRF